MSAKMINFAKQKKDPVNGRDSTERCDFGAHGAVCSANVVECE